MKKIEGKQIFLLDAIGAIISIIFLFLLFLFEGLFEIKFPLSAGRLPDGVLAVFFVIASIFALNSVILFIISPKSWKFYLKMIALLNIGYCLFTTYQITQNQDTLTPFGLLYFVAEIMVIIALAIYEWKNASNTEEIQAR